MPTAAGDAPARDPETARQDPGDATRRQPRGSGPRSGEGGAGSHTDDRAQGAVAVTTPSDAPESFPNGNGENPEKEVVGVRRGMFGPTGSGDTSGYGRLVREVVLPGSSPRPYGGYFDEVVDTLASVLGDETFTAAVERVVVYRDQLTIEVRRQHLPAVMAALRDDAALRFELCLGVSGVHYPQDAGRELHAVYPLMSITHNRRIQVEATAPDA